MENAHHPMHVIVGRSLKDPGTEVDGRVGMADRAQNGFVDAIQPPRETIEHVGDFGFVDDGLKTGRKLGRVGRAADKLRHERRTRQPFQKRNATGLARLFRACGVLFMRDFGGLFGLRRFLCCRCSHLVPRTYSWVIYGASYLAWVVSLSYIFFSGLENRGLARIKIGPKLGAKTPIFGFIVVCYGLKWLKSCYYCLGNAFERQNWKPNVPIYALNGAF